MKRALPFLLMAACTSAETEGSIGPIRSEQRVYVGEPNELPLGSCDASGSWWPSGSYSPVGHSVQFTDSDDLYIPAEGSPRMTLFRRNLPFPRVSWKARKLETTVMVFPSSGGLVARYHVTNHGEEATACRLLVGNATKFSSPPRRRARTGHLYALDEPAEESPEDTLTFDLRIDPGQSRFAHVSTVDLGTKLPKDALEDAAARWEKHLRTPRLTIPDEAQLTLYGADLAAALMGVTGCREAVERFHATLARADGDALRLFPGVPDAWLEQSFHATGLPTLFGDLDFTFEGGDRRRTIDLSGACRPTGGFVVAAAGMTKATVDGRETPIKDGLLRIPPGSRKVQLTVAE